MKKSGPDSLSSWIISVACCFINMMMFGMIRLSGVLFVASITRFKVDREQASFPYTFATFISNTSGPLVGFLGHKFGVRATTTFGCFLGAVGIGLCYFAESTFHVTLLWGTVFGLGFGLGNTLLPVSINQYFDKYRATASGISFSGAGIGSFLLPPVVEILLNIYGLSETFLFLSGLVLMCVPAALMLKKPNFEIETTSPYEQEKNERQNLISGKKVNLYTVENDSTKSHVTSKCSTIVNTVQKAEDNDVQESNHILKYEERMKKLPTQKLLSSYSICMSTSEPQDFDQIMENSKSRKQVNFKVPEAETFILSSHNTPNSKKDIFETDIRSASVEYEKATIPFNRTRAFSSEHIASDNEKKYFTNKYKESHQNYSYKTDIEEVNFSNLKVKNSNFILKNCDSQSIHTNEKYFNCSYQKQSDNYKFLSEQFKRPSDKSKDCVKDLDWPVIEKIKIKNQLIPAFLKKDKSKAIEKSSFGTFSVIFDPMFILIAITNSIYSFTFICMITILVDFARDLQIGASNEKYVIMTLSVGDIIGRLSLGWITDLDYMSTTAFMAFCFACQGLTIAAIVWSDGFSTLIILVTLYGFSEAGLIVIFPVTMAQYIDYDKQTVAVPTSSFLSGPMCLAVAPLIGFFRDEIGAYDWIFYGLGILSAACCLSWMLAPFIARCQKRH